MGFCWVCCKLSVNCILILIPYTFMQHHIYNTEGFVLGSLPHGEANSFIYIFTRELGLVGARAQSVRTVSSKLRFSLQDFSYAKVSLVRGKNVWRITNATLINNFHTDFKNEPEKAVVCANVFALLKKLLAGEEKNAELFGIISDGLLFLKNSCEKGDVSQTELLLVLKILHNLGYIGDHSKLESFIKIPEWSREVLQEMLSIKNEALLHVNNALKASQL